jgi:hypothetical protein
LHEFLRGVGTWTWLACAGFMAAFLCFNKRWLFGYRSSLFAPGITMAIWFGVSYLLIAKLLRGIAAYTLTPKGERCFWDVKSSKGYLTLQNEGYFEVNKDFDKGAFDKAVKSS